MADEDKKGKAVSASTPSTAGKPKKAAVKKKTAKKKVAKKKVAEKKTAAAATVASKVRSEKGERQVEVSDGPRDKGSVRDAATAKAKPATAVAAPASGSQSRKIDYLFALLLVVFLVASIVILRDEKAREGATGQQQGILQTIKDAFGNMKADTASLFQWEKESVPPVVAPRVTKDALAPAGNEAAAVEAAPQATPQYRVVPGQQPRLSDAPVAASVAPPMSESQADAEPVIEPRVNVAPVTEPRVNVAPVSEPQVNVAPVAEPAVVIPAETEVPAAQVSEPAQPQVQAPEEPVQAVVAEPVTSQPAAAPPTRRHGYDPYSRYPYAYPGWYGRDYDSRRYDRAYPRRPPQRWSR